MPRISCSVGSCSYNREGLCGSDILNIGGSRARVTETTFCETYLKLSAYNNVAEYAVNAGETKDILCKVDTCAYHVREHCHLNEIEVGSLKDVENYTETDCLSFERR